MGRPFAFKQLNPIITPTGSAKLEIKFGDFYLLPSKRLLMEGQAPVPIGSRALDLLIALVERAGALVSKEELMRSVWPETHVVESNLSVHIAALRRILRDGEEGRRYIVNSIGRGYRFVEPVEVAFLTSAAKSNVPQDKLRGRLTALAGLTAGKRSLANAADRLIPVYRDGALRVDLITISDAPQVPRAVAAALGTGTDSTNPLGSLVAALRDKELLLVLDNCDQVLEAAASLAVALLKADPAVHVLLRTKRAMT